MANTFLLRDPLGLDLIASATGDTAEIFHGGPAYSTGGGHSGSGRRGQIHGQRVRVERLGRVARSILGPRVSEVILVPWDYDASCRPVAWSGSAAWAPIGERALFRAVPRHDESWLYGIPILDVYTADQQPYSPALLREELRTSSVGGVPLTPDELLDLRDAMPDRSTEGDTLVELQWLRRLAGMRTLHGRFPFDAFPRHARWAITRERLRVHPLPTGGTYAITARFPGGVERRFVLRSMNRAHSDLDTSTVTHRDHDPAVGPSPMGLNLEYRAAPSEDAFGACAQDERYAGIGELDWSPAPGTDGTRVWRASMQEDLVRALLTPDEERRVREAERALRPPSDPALVTSRYLPEFTFRFVESLDGRMTLTGTIRVQGLGEVRISGTRTSLITRDAQERCYEPPIR